MSPSGPYRSQSLKFVVQRIRQLRDDAQRLLRYGNLAAVWGIQLLLYPLYVLVQTTRRVGFQLRQSVQRLVPQLRSASSSPDSARHGESAHSEPLAESSAEPELELTVDVPVQHVLEAIASMPLAPLLPSAEEAIPTPLPLATATSLAATHPGTLAIQGIASMLGDRHLVLVTPDHQLLDILTPEQQIHLYRRMVMEMALYWRSRRLHAERQRLQSGAPLPLPPLSTRPTLLPPIRWVNRAVNWMQMSPVAIAANLFQEAHLAPLPEEINPWVLPGQTSPLPSVGAVSPPEAPKALPGHILPQLQQGWHRIKAWVRSSTPGELTITPARNAQKAATPPTGWHIGAIAQALQQWWHSGSQGNQLSPPSQIPTQEQHQPSTMPAAMSPPIGGAFRPTVPTPQPLQPAPLSSPQQTNLQPREVSPSQTERPQSHGAIAPMPTESTGSMEGREPDWIDVDASLVEYVKHPLEQLLEWVDLGMAWLETRLAQLLRWWRDREGS
jgi:hypothetical protein